MIKMIQNRYVFTGSSDSPLLHSGYGVNQYQMKTMLFIKGRDGMVGNTASYPARRPIGLQFRLKLLVILLSTSRHTVGTNLQI
jgi:hypothetical protein